MTKVIRQVGKFVRAQLYDGSVVWNGGMWTPRHKYIHLNIQACLKSRIKHFISYIGNKHLSIMDSNDLMKILSIYASIIVYKV